MRRESGFTLLEVIVAVGIVSLVLIAVFQQMALTTVTATALREAAIASWIGQNQIAEIRLGDEFPEVSEFNGDVEFANARWRWQAVVSETGVEDLRRMDVEVSLADDPDNVIRTVSGFLTPPAPATVAGGWPAGGSDGGPGTDPRRDQTPADDTVTPPEDTGGESETDAEDDT